MRNQSRGSGGGGRAGHDEERLQQLVSRMRNALQLGLRHSSRELRWGNTDAQLQGQAVRAISAFVAAIPSRRFPVTHLQTYIEEAVAALEYLLAVEQDTVYRQAAAASAGLGKATNGRYMQRLLSPLACLLAPSKASDAAVSAATAMQSILVAARPQIAFDGTMDDDPIWKVLRETDVLKHILWQLDKNRSVAGIAECAEFLAIILERWPGARYRVGHVEAVRSALLHHCMSSNDAVVVASLRACQALVLCAGVAVLYLQDAVSLWRTLARCLHHSQPLHVHREALRLLSLVGRLSLFSKIFFASFEGPYMQGILDGLLRNINEGNKPRLTVVEQGVVLEAAHTTSVILRWAGEHHTVVLEMGIIKFLSLQLTLGEKNLAANATIWKGPSQKVDVEGKSRGAGKVTSSLRSLLWEIVGYLAAHFNSSTTNEVLLGRPPSGPSLAGITVFACSALLRALHRSGHVSHTSSDDPTPVAAFGNGEQHISAQELLQISKTMFLLLSTTCSDVSAPTKACMEATIRYQDQAWLPRLVDSLAIGHTGPSLVKPESVQTATNLFALACFSYFPECRELLPQERTLDVLTAILKIYGNRALQKNQRVSNFSAKWSVVHERAGIAAKTCCEEIAEDWEGTDIVLFSSLCAFTKVLQGSERARTVAKSLRRGRLTEDSCSEGSYGGTVSLLWALAESTTVAPGIRWWAASGLACFNIYGFPSPLGRNICQIFDEALFPDVAFLLKDGSRLFAHGVILAVQCPSVLPKGLRRKEKILVGDSVVHGIQLSKMISSRSFKALLEIAYSGVVHLDLEEVDEMKLLSKGCGLDSLTNLLHGRVPVWGSPPTSCNLASALNFGSYKFPDIILRGRLQGRTVAEAIPCKLKEGCNETSTHVHGHRAILSSRCDYYRGLFCSGMRESTANAIDIDISQQSLETLLLYWYSGKLIRLTQTTGWCSWNNLETDKQILYLQNLIELSEFAGQHLMTDLQEDCYHLVLQHIEGCNLHLGPSVLTHAEKCAQWNLVNMCANSLAPAYPHLRDVGAFESLNEDFQEILRAAHIQSISHSDTG
ncbi:hypothetical protein KC19_VG064400 [Ceratodon purpureus]|uniref:BTB domain-containing protein n=1 Tax=Ceratodon purpureus TaxID=3225 RepID=A0A8T0HMD2_CERPU|nr:hypothetical protein KC19_VG064400 [Ceratodon purpureus]